MCSWAELQNCWTGRVTPMEPVNVLYATMRRSTMGTPFLSVWPPIFVTKRDLPSCTKIPFALFWSPSKITTSLTAAQAQPTSMSITRMRVEKRSAILHCSDGIRKNSMGPLLPFVHSLRSPSPLFRCLYSVVHEVSHVYIASRKERFWSPFSQF
jgi:hypothetical protein